MPEKTTDRAPSRRPDSRPPRAAVAIKARYADGVLEIQIPEQPRVEATRIAVTVN